MSESRPRFKTDLSLTIMLDSTSSTTVTKSKPSDFPSFLRQKLSSVQTVQRHEVNTEARTNQTCPKCGRLEVRFSAVQLRSADEGSTIFFTCDCGYKYVILLHNHHVTLLINQQVDRKQLDARVDTTASLYSSTWLLSRSRAVYLHLGRQPYYPGMTIIFPT